MIWLTRQRFEDNGEVKLTVWAKIPTSVTVGKQPRMIPMWQVVAYIRRKRHNGGLVYILLDKRDWFVSSYDTLREAFERASSPKF